MSGFSAHWLRLREAADHQARDAGLLRLLAEWCSPRASLTVLDLGCGTGSNARATAASLAPAQHWRLVDHDAALLEVASQHMAAWSAPGGRAVTVSTEIADLTGGLDPLLSAPCDLVTAAALFDLVSTDWLDGLVAALAARSLPLYTVLIYDGAMTWEPPHLADEAIREAFNAHQRTDKGFGPAAGPDAGPHLTTRLTEAGFRVVTAPSPWLLGPPDHALLSANAVGIADAAREMSDLPDADISAWLTLRSQGGRCTIGHLDMLALPFR